MISMVKYPASFVQLKNASLEMVKLGEERYILAKGTESNKLGFLDGRTWNEDPSRNGILYPLTHSNRLALNRLVSHTSPTAFGNSVASFGTGDRLGLATSGHIKAFEGSLTKPVLAQQSKRELNLTGRTYKDVLDDVSFNVFQAGYTKGFGADGDHLKSKEDIKAAIEDGYTMITLDCSDYIGKQAGTDLSSLPAGYLKEIGKRYLGKLFRAGHLTFSFSENELYTCVLIYKAAIDYAGEIYDELILAAGKSLDFELSIDETQSVTTALHHLFVAEELNARNIKITSLAPRFTGEFQKGIDYIGDPDEFKKHIEMHAAIADHYGYKLSIHSGSDKFSVFPFIGAAAGTNLHVKTSGTSWLEAVRVIAAVDPRLFRNIYKIAINNFNEAKTYYYVSTSLSSVEDIDRLPDEELKLLLNHDDYRQILHITYGYILNDPETGPDFFRVLKSNQDLYDDGLKKHIGRHLSSLNLGG